MHSSDELFQRPLECYFCVYSPSCNVGNKHTNNTRVSTETVRHDSAYIILFLTRHYESINGDKNEDVYTSSPCLIRSVFILLMTSQTIADNVTMTRQL